MSCQRWGRTLQFLFLRVLQTVAHIATHSLIPHVNNHGFISHTPNTFSSPEPSPAILSASFSTPRTKKPYLLKDPITPSLPIPLISSITRNTRLNNFGSEIGIQSNIDQQVEFQQIWVLCQFEEIYGSQFYCGILHCDI